MIGSLERAIERTLSSLRALDAVPETTASAAHPANDHTSASESRGPAADRSAPGPGDPGRARPRTPTPQPSPTAGASTPPLPASGAWEVPGLEADPANPRTLEDLYREHRMRFVRLAILLVDDPATAEDVVQEAFTGLYRHWSRLHDETTALGYQRAAVVNGSRSVLRRRRTARGYTPPHTAAARSAESLAMLSAEHQAVVSALGRLPRRQREVLVLRYYGGLSEAEIAGAVGISRGTVKSTASRGLGTLSKIVGGGR